MTYKICYWDEVEGCQKERDATPEESAEIDALKANPIMPTKEIPTKEQLMVELAALTAKINALGA